jgi:hypothetical protein
MHDTPCALKRQPYMSLSLWSSLPMRHAHITMQTTFIPGRGLLTLSLALSLCRTRTPGFLATYVGIAASASFGQDIHVCHCPLLGSTGHLESRPSAGRVRHEEQVSLSHWCVEHGMLQAIKATTYETSHP